MRALLAIDPAAEMAASDTGWATGVWSDTKAFEILDSGVIRGGFAGFADWWADMVVGLGVVDVVVCEKYVPFRSAGDHSPLLIEGLIRGTSPVVVALQPASGKNTLVPDALLKRNGLWSTQGHHHDEREAIRHALVYMFKLKHKPTIARYAPPT